MIPNCISYDPTFHYELAVIMQDGMRRMFQEQEDVFYYLTVMNENYSHQALPRHEAGILKGLYRLSEGGKVKGKGKKALPRVQLMGSGTILREVMAAAELLEPRIGAWPPTSGARPASTNCAARPRTSSAGTCSTRTEKGQGLLREGSAWTGTRKARSSPPPTTCAPSPTRFDPT